MKKIALAATIDDAYRFFFRNIISIIGVAWFPAVVFVAVLAALVAAFVPHEWLIGQVSGPIDFKTFIATRLPVILITMPVITITGLLVSAIIRVGILEHAVGKRTTKTLFYFSLGAPVWRMAGAEILTAIVIILLALAEVAVGVALHFAVSAIHNISFGLVVLFDIVQAIALIVLLVYIGVRLFFFLPAVIVVENRIGFGRAWSLGAGNVGRVIVIFLAVFLPVSIVTGMISNVTVMPVMLSHMMALGNQPSPAETMAVFKSLLPLLPVTLGVQLIGSLVITGTILGAIGKAYRAVTADEAV